MFFIQFRCTNLDDCQKEEGNFLNLLQKDGVPRKWEGGGSLRKGGEGQSFPYEHHCECYKKLASWSWPVLFALTNFFLIHTVFFWWKIKTFFVMAVFLSKLDLTPLFIDILRDYSSVKIGYNMISKRNNNTTNATHCL